MTRHHRPIPNRCSVFIDAMSTISRPTHPQLHIAAPKRHVSMANWSPLAVLVCCLAGGLLLLV